jgi:SpoVK/Ycf46/Vps4 family AAA+-type ATPase
MSKWYGESELRLDRIFELARKAGEENGGIIVMIDEIDEIGGNREDSHEST